MKAPGKSRSKKSASPAKKQPGRPKPRSDQSLLSSVTSRGQTTIPAALRRRFGIGSDTRLEWLDDGEMMLVIPVPPDPIRHYRGKSKGSLTISLLQERKGQRDNEG